MSTSARDIDEAVGKTIADAAELAMKTNRYFIAVPDGFGDWFYFRVARKQVLDELAGLRPDKALHSRLVRSPSDGTFLCIGSLFEQADRDSAGSIVEVHVEGFSLPFEVQRS